LAVELIDSGWSMKHLHRLMVTSQTYCQTATCNADDEANRRIDPDNRYLWHFAPRRVESEVIRDSVLAVGGALDRAIGGADLPVDQELTSRRRGLYFNVRPLGFAGLGTLASFDAPDPAECYRRSESVMPQQALALTNGQLVLTQGRMLARKLSEELANSGSETASSEVAFIVAAYETVLCRSPTGDERQACLEFLQQQADLLARVGAQDLPAVTPEGLPPPAIEPAERAREGLIRALLNHTEFVTIR
jgi:hypothetical protein